MRKAILVAALVLLGASGAWAQSLTGSYVEPVSPTEICPDQDYTFTFYVWNGSVDVEWIDLVEVTFPAGMVIDAGTAGYDNPSWSFGFALIGQTAQWYDSDGSWGEIYDQEGGNFFVDANTGGLAGGTTFDWHLSGDDYGAPPHELYGSFDIPVGSTATEASTWGAVKALLD